MARDRGCAHDVWDVWAHSCCFSVTHTAGGGAPPLSKPMDSPSASRRRSGGRGTKHGADHCAGAAEAVPGNERPRAARRTAEGEASAVAAAGEGRRSPPAQSDPRPRRHPPTPRLPRRRETSDVNTFRVKNGRASTRRTSTAALARRTAPFSGAALGCRAGGAGAVRSAEYAADVRAL